MTCTRKDKSLGDILAIFPWAFFIFLNKPGDITIPILTTNSGGEFYGMGLPGYSRFS